MTGKVHQYVRDLQGRPKHHSGPCFPEQVQDQLKAAAGFLWKDQVLPAVSKPLSVLRTKMPIRPSHDGHPVLLLRRRGPREQNQAPRYNYTGSLAGTCQIYKKSGEQQRRISGFSLSAEGLRKARDS